MRSVLRFFLRACAHGEGQDLGFFAYSPACVRALPFPFLMFGCFDV